MITISEPCIQQTSLHQNNLQTKIIRKPYHIFKLQTSMCSSIRGQSITGLCLCVIMPQVKRQLWQSCIIGVQSHQRSPHSSEVHPFLANDCVAALMLQECWRKGSWSYITIIIIIILIMTIIIIITIIEVQLPYLNIGDILKLHHK